MENKDKDGDDDDDDDLMQYDKQTTLYKSDVNHAYLFCLMSMKYVDLFRVCD